MNKTLNALLLLTLVMGTLGDANSQRRKREAREQAIANIKQQQAHALHPPPFTLHPPLHSLCPHPAADGRGA